MLDKKIHLELTQAEPFLKRLAQSYVKDRVKAKDLYQETITKALTKIHLFKPGTSFKNWSATIMRNTFINDYRRSRKYNIEPLHDYPYIPERWNNRNQGEINLAVEEVNKEIRLLHPDYQQIINMVGAGYRYQEIADELELPLGTVKSRIHFARKKLSKSLARA